MLVAEVRPSDLPPVRYGGCAFIRIGPRRDIATEAEERILAERRCSFLATFDATPCLNAKLEDLDVDYIKNTYLPKFLDEATLATDNRDIKEQLASIHLYDRENDCPTYAGIILFGTNPKYFLLGDYVQFVRFAGKDKGGDILNERQFSGPLYKMLPALESFVNDGIITQRPVPESFFREKTVWNYPEGAIRELMMNAGGLYGEARPENFPSVNDYRNPLVAEAMRMMKYVNKFNRGVTRVQEMLKENGNTPAVFDVNTITAFRVTVQATNEADLSKGTSQGTSQDNKIIEEKIIEFCKEPRSLAEITAHCGFQDKRKFRERYLNPLLGTCIQMTIPDKPTSRFQKYRLIY